jgi:putative tryptophan/tyrosine transport system substrate-binding protein
MTTDIKRREFITLLGGAAVAWPLAARAQQSERMRRIGVLIPLAADDPESQRRLTAFVQGLQELGWTDGRNIRIETRWTAGDTDRMRRHAAELVALAPDVILASGGTVVGALLEASRTTPIVFTLTVDPVGAGHVASLARPGGNATGFTGYEYGLAAKWLELLKEIAPRVTRAAVLRDTATPQGVGLFAVIRGASSALSVELRPVDVRNADEIERGITAVAREGNGGLIVTASGLAIVHRDLIITLAARHKLPAIYFQNYFVHAGGLVSYGPDPVEPHRQAAQYVDRILKGENPGDLPVQAPTKYQLTISLKTAKALGLEVPPTLLARADEVIE